MLPERTMSLAQLVLIALCCDTFHATKGLFFLSSFALEEFLQARVRIAGDRFGTNFWTALRTQHPFPPSRQRRGRRIRRKPRSLFTRSWSSPTSFVEHPFVKQLPPPSPSPCSFSAPHATSSITAHCLHATNTFKVVVPFKVLQALHMGSSLLMLLWWPLDVPSDCPLIGNIPLKLDSSAFNLQHLSLWALYYLRLSSQTSNRPLVRIWCWLLPCPAPARGQPSNTLRSCYWFVICTSSHLSMPLIRNWRSISFILALRVFFFFSTLPF